MTPALARAAIGAVLAAAIVLAALRARSLSPSGAAAAWVVGVASVLAGWAWAALLMLFFVSGSLLSRLGGARKAQRVRAVVAKGDERDAMQVLANGGIFALAAIGQLIQPSTAMLAIGVGSLAAAAADTFATEIGTLATNPPRSIISGRRVPPGTSGGVSLAGSLGMLAGAMLIAGGVALAGAPHAVALAAFAGGVGGAIADSVLGATLQARRRCPACDVATERAVHDCGTATHHAGGLTALGNDGVNVACTIVGGLLSAWLAR